jgi:hypothetical protein
LFAKPCRYIWASGADGQFTVSEDEGENEDLGRGTLIKIHLKEGEEVSVFIVLLYDIFFVTMTCYICVMTYGKERSVLAVDESYAAGGCWLIVVTF